MQNMDFAEATRLFHSGEYEQGLSKISTCILANPEHSMLYSNRALFYYQLKSHEKAIHDLETAIEINYLNYIAYFNLFSIELRVGGLEKEAFEDLCCSLSILYFLRGKIRKTEIDVQKSLKYCENNIEAHILKGMMHLENNKLKLAINEINWALQFEPQNILIKRLKYILNQKSGFQNLQEEENPQQNPFQSGERYQPQKRSRLECSVQIDENTNLQEEITDKLSQFTEVYNELNNQIGTVTQRILIQNDEHLHLETSILSQVSGIWQGTKRQKIFVRDFNKQNKFQIKSIKNSIEQVDSSLQAQQMLEQQAFIYDNIILKEFDPEEEERMLQANNNILQNEGIEVLKDQIVQNQHQTNKTQLHQVEMNSRPSQKADYFTQNQRQDLYQQNWQEKQQSFDIPYDMLNKKFIKKEDQLKSSSPIQILKEKPVDTTYEREKSCALEQNSNDSSPAEFILPEPQGLQHSGSQLSQKNQTPSQLSHPNRCMPSEKIAQEKNLAELEQTGNSGCQTDQLSDAILSYSSETKMHSNYGEILTKQNKNIQFHQSQVMQRSLPLHEVDQNGQITLIDDLISQSSYKAKQTVDVSSSFTKKDSIKEKLADIKDRVVKSLEVSVKNKDHEFIQPQNESKTSESQKLTKKFEIVQLYPFSLPKKQIFFLFSSLQFSKKYKVSQLDELYLVGVYHLSIPKYKMKTQPRKIDSTICQWNENFPEMNLLQQPRSLKITVFNKAKGRNARDELLGEAQKQVTQTGEFRIPIHQKKILIGYVKYAVWAF